MKTRINAYTRALCLALGLTLMSWSGAAQAASWAVEFSGELTVVPVELVPIVNPGDPFSLTMLLDVSAPNEATSPDFLATSAPGTFSSFMIIPLGGVVDTVSATGGTSWNSTGNIVVDDGEGNIFYMPYTMTLSGAGLTPGQILPDFTSFSGTIDIDLSILGLVLGAPLANPIVTAEIQGIAIPEPGTAILMLLGLGGLAAARRSRLA